MLTLTNMLDASMFRFAPTQFSLSTLHPSPSVAWLSGSARARLVLLVSSSTTEQPPLLPALHPIPQILSLSHRVQARNTFDGHFFLTALAVVSQHSPCQYSQLHSPSLCSSFLSGCDCKRFWSLNNTSCLKRTGLFLTSGGHSG